MLNKCVDYTNILSYNNCEIKIKCKKGSEKLDIIKNIKPLFDVHLRDTCICTGADNMYYLTGSIGEDIWSHNDGIQLWRSKDLKHWEDMGLVWSFEKDATWQKEWRIHHGKPIRSIWAPEIHYIKNNYYITYSTPPSGTGILKSATGLAEGPYINALAEDKPLTEDIDASLFCDDDGNVYFIYSGGNIAKMTENIDALEEEPRRLLCNEKDDNPLHHGAKKYFGHDEVGYEGAAMFKRNGKYYLSCADTYEGRYSSMAAWSDNIYGPYYNRHEAIKCGGHNNYFKAFDGQWYGTMFGNDKYAPFIEKPAIVKIRFNENGLIEVEETQ